MDNKYYPLFAHSTDELRRLADGPLAPTVRLAVERELSQRQAAAPSADSEDQLIPRDQQRPRQRQYGDSDQ